MEIVCRIIEDDAEEITTITILIGKKKLRLGKRNENFDDFSIRSNRGRGGPNTNNRGGRGRGRGNRGMNNNNNNNRNVTKESLDTELDKYMAQTKLDPENNDMDAV